MKRPVITLYVNDPMGRKCQANFAAASQAQAAFGAELAIVKDTSPGYRPGVDPPVASVALDGTPLDPAAPPMGGDVEQAAQRRDRVERIAGGGLARARRGKGRIALICQTHLHHRLHYSPVKIPSDIPE